NGSITTTVVAPKALAAAAVSTPIGPAPATSTEAPALTAALRTAAIPTPSGSSRAASSSVISDGIGKAKSAGATMYSAKAPCTGGAEGNSTSRQRLYWP